MEFGNNWVDSTIKCVECNKNFIFSAGEKKFYEAKGLRLPKRCPACRDHRRALINPPDKGMNH